jgi:acetoin utilization deacetylase AcuC-like enzyme
MSMLTIFYSEKFLDHHTGSTHPERPQRLQAIVERLKTSEIAGQLCWQEPKPATREQLLWVHEPALIDLVEETTQGGGGYLDPDTVVSPQSFAVALLAAGGWLDGVDAVLASGQPAWVVARPPGHHAERNQAMGFCLFSNAALAAHYALRSGVERVAILDWDVHHGNGTQQICWDEPRIAYVSLHQSPHYPGTGQIGECGAHQNILNIPLPARCGRKEYQAAFDQQVWPFIENFQPELLIVSAGFDANYADPLAEMALLPKDFGDFARQCLARIPKVLFGLEGGYDLESLAESVLAVSIACLEPRKFEVPNT